MEYDASPMKKRRQGVKSCSSISESVPLTSANDNSLVRFVSVLALPFVFLVCVDNVSNL